MQAYYCDGCDSVIIHEGHSQTERPTQHQHIRDNSWYPLTYIGYYHPDFKVCEIEGIVRAQIETFGLVTHDQPL